MRKDSQDLLEAAVDIPASSPELNATVVNDSYSTRTRGHATANNPASNTKRMAEGTEKTSKGLSGLPSALDLPTRSQLLRPVGQAARVRECLFLLVWVIALLFGNRYYERLQADNAKASAVALEQGAVRIALAANAAARHFRKESERASRALEGFGAVLDKALITADTHPIIFESGTSRRSIYHDQLLLLDENRVTSVNTPARAKSIDSKSKLLMAPGCLVPSRTSGEDQDQGGDRSRPMTAEEVGVAMSLHMCPLSAAAVLIDAAVKEKDPFANNNNNNNKDGKSEARDNLNDRQDSRRVSGLQSILLDVRRRMRVLRVGVGEQTIAVSSQNGGKQSQRRVLLEARQGHGENRDNEVPFAKSEPNNLAAGKKRGFSDTNDALGGQIFKISTTADESQPFVFRYYEHLPNTLVAPIDGFEVFLLKLFNTLPNPSTLGDGHPTRPREVPSSDEIASSPTFHNTVITMFHTALEKLYRVDGRSKCTACSSSSSSGHNSGDGGGDGDVDRRYVVPENADNAQEEYEGGDEVDYYYFERSYARKPLLFSCDPRQESSSSIGGEETRDTENEKDQTCAMSAAAREEHRGLMAARYDFGRSRGRWRFGANNNPPTGLGSSDIEEKEGHASVKGDGLSSDVTASVVSPVAEAFIEAYYALYRYYQVVRRVKEVREVLEPLIHAIMRRNDTMLYNYI